MSGCLNCSNEPHSDHEYCEICIKELIRVCTCSKEFIKESPKLVYIENKTKTFPIPKDIPPFYLTKIRQDYWHILGCRGCSFTKEEIENNFDKALRAAIVSCVYQKIDDKYEYVSDSLDLVFEEYLIKKGIKVGDPCDI